ncbi:hypothetical protein CsSME_00023468 [Camellia sinensis var. sinensis]
MPDTVCGEVVFVAYVSCGTAGVNSAGSRWTRSCECKRQEALGLSSRRKIGVNMPG